MASADAILTAARQVFGFRALRPGQREAVESVLGGRDTLAVLATGGGKSAIYALAGHLLQGPTLVISPLIALQHDQLAALQGRASAVAIRAVSCLIDQPVRSRAARTRRAFAEDQRVTPRRT